ncbi:hypothetical protein [Alkalilimnicola ehrlichii]|uniref:hypothetical protein n=1 Tax=Alkalilimnicola ehrlichii TaxID=351052 RepID=UPI0011C081BD|nr:hypothetical protein [Alkalilimnicola ehrlichii]
MSLRKRLEQAIRRRYVALAGGMTLLAVVAWALPKLSGTAATTAAPRPLLAMTQPYRKKRKWHVLPR